MRHLVFPLVRVLKRWPLLRPNRTGPHGEGFIACKLPGERLGLKVGLPLMQVVFASMTLPEIARFFRLMPHGGLGPRDRMDQEKKPYIFVGMVGAPVSMWDFVLSQCSGNAGLLIWMLANAVWSSKNRISETEWEETK